MDIDIHSKALHLLEKIANSVYERDTKTQGFLCFGANEVKVVEKWLEDFLGEYTIIGFSNEIRVIV